jgi:hypothetical protein
MYCNQHCGIILNFRLRKMLLTTKQHFTAVKYAANWSKKNRRPSSSLTNLCGYLGTVARKAELLY